MVGTGTVRGIQQQVEVIAQRTPVSPLQWGMFGVNKVMLRGSFEMDSFNSMVGPYPQSRRTNGDIGTNAIRVASIDIDGSVIVNGNLLIGPGGNPNTAIRVRGSSMITGSQTAATSAATLPCPVPPDGVLCSGALLLDGGEVRMLQMGTYWFSQLRLRGSASLQTTGPVILYISGPVTLSGSSNVVGSSHRPPDLIVKVTNHSDVTIQGSARLNGVIYAPRSLISLRGSAEVYGALIGREVRLDGSARLHYDEALGGEDRHRRPSAQRSPPLAVLSWHTL